MRSTPGRTCGSRTPSTSRTATSSGSSRPQNKECGISFEREEPINPDEGTQGALETRKQGFFRGHLRDVKGRTTSAKSTQPLSPSPNTAAATAKTRSSRTHSRQTVLSAEKGPILQPASGESGGSAPSPGRRWNDHNRPGRGRSSVTTSLLVSRLCASIWKSVAGKGTPNPPSALRGTLPVMRRCSEPTCFTVDRPEGTGGPRDRARTCRCHGTRTVGEGAPAGHPEDRRAGWIPVRVSQ